MEAARRYYVKNPIMLGEDQGIITVVGFARDQTPYNVDRGHVIEVPAEGVPQPGIAKLIRNKCIVPYDAKKHAGAILDSLPVQRTTFPAWAHEEEPGREMEREMVAVEEAAKRETFLRRRRGATCWATSEGASERPSR